MNKCYRRKHVMMWVSICLFSIIGVDPAFSQKPRVAVVDFDMRVRGVDAELGSAMAEYLTDELFKAGKYRIVDRTNMKDVLAEQQRVLYGSIDESTGAQVGKMLGAEYIVIGVLTKFSEKKGGGFLGAISNKIPVGVGIFTSEIRFGLKIINATTGELMESRTIKKKKKSAGIVAAGNLIGMQFAGVLYKSKSMENALEEAIREAVQLIDAKLPTTGSKIAESGPDYVADCDKLIGNSAPAIMVVIPEIHIRRPIPDPAGETEIIRVFLESDFNLIDQKQIAAIRTQERVINATKDPQLAASLGVEFGADIIIIGEAFSEFAAREGNRISCRARVEARAISTRTGKILAAHGKHASAWDVAEGIAAKKALRDAGGKIAAYFKQQLCRKMGDSSPALTSVEIFVGSTNFMNLRALEKIVKRMPGVKSSRKKMTGSVGRIFVDFSGSSEDLADALLDGQTDALPFEITGFDAAKLEVKMMPGISGKK